MNELRILLQDLLVDTIGFREVIASLLITIIVVVLWILVGKIINAIGKRSISRFYRKKKGEKRGKTLSALTYTAFKVVVWFVVIMLIVMELGFDITPILATAGILGLAIGFGAQNLVRDVISGFFLIVDNVFNIGETVEIGSFRGSVVAMNLRNTTLRNFMGSELIVNNGSISSVINWSRNDTIALVDFGVAYDTDLSKVTEIMPAFMETLKETYEQIIEVPSFLGVTALADSSINMRIMAKTTNGNHWMIERKIRHELVQYLNKHDIEIPFPQIVVHQDQ